MVSLAKQKDSLTLLFRKRLKRKSRTLVQDSRRFTIFSQKEGQYVVVVVVVVVVLRGINWVKIQGGMRSLAKHKDSLVTISLWRKIKLGQDSTRHTVFS